MTAVAVDDRYSQVRGRRAARLAAPLVALLAVALAGCGLVPPQSVGDPLGLDGKSVAVTFGALGPAGVLVPAAVTGTGELEFTFPDHDWPDLPLSPGKLTNDITIASATLNVGADEAPASITVSDIDLTVYLWHGAATYDAATERVSVTVENSGPVTLNRTGCDAGGCTYSYDGSALAFGTVSYSGTAVATALKVLAQEPEPNRVRAVATLRAEPEGPLAGKTLTIEFEAGSGTVSL